MNITQETLEAAQAGCAGKVDRDAPAILAVVRAFRCASTDDRSRLAQQLGALKRLLEMESLFQQQLFPVAIKVRVQSDEAAQQVTEALFGMGCGLFNGTYPLVKDSDIGGGPFIGVHATRAGALGFWLAGNEESFSASDAVEVAEQDVLQAASLDGLLERMRRGTQAMGACGKR